MNNIPISQGGYQYESGQLTPPKDSLASFNWDINLDRKPNSQTENKQSLNTPENIIDIESKEID